MTKEEITISKEEYELLKSGKKAVVVSVDELEELEAIRQTKKAKQKIELPSLVPAMPKYKKFPDIFTLSDITKIFNTIETSTKLYQSPKGYQDSTYNEFRRLRDLTMVSLNYYLAFRPSEVVGLKYSDIRLEDDGSLVVVVSPESNKVRTSRVIPIPKQLVPLLMEYVKKHKGTSKWLFPTLYGTKISSDRYREVFKEILEEAGLYHNPTRGTHGHRSLYTLRHSRATHLLDQGANLFQVQQLLGHKSLEVTSVYLHQTDIFKKQLRGILEGEN